MKALSEEELKNAPSKVQYVYMASVAGISLGGEMIESAIKEHPEYFPDEVEARRKWNSVPQEVHDAYWKEWAELQKEAYKDMQPSKGIIGWIRDGDFKGMQEWQEDHEKLSKIAEPLEQALHEKHYGEYGLKYIR